jgi:hypothetical protein
MGVNLFKKSNIINKIKNDSYCGYRIKAITSAFKAEDEGSIPSIRSI